MHQVIEKKADLTIGKYAITKLRMEFMDPTVSYYSSALVIVVPVGEPLTSLEKLMKPFSDKIWMCVMAVLLLAFSIIAVIRNRFGRKTQNFILGSKNTSPYLNTLRIFIGDTLTIIPKGCFARTILGMFIIYCFVIRHSYTGALFNFIRSNNFRKPTASTIDEMVQKDFSFYMIPPNVELIRLITRVYENRKVMKASEISATREKLNDPFFKGGMLSNYEQIIYFNQINRLNFTLSICPETLLTSQYTIYFQKNSFLVTRFDREIENLQTNGLMNRIVGEWVQVTQKIEKRQPTPLTLFQVNGIFLVLMFCHALASMVVILEILSKRFAFLRKVFK